ncbi:MAG: TRAP transporter small permease [Burkholderiaceae bacterium]|jgi:TRAP-type C4-dicarboxylate transport system permease small subunit|nr:TRAP transporter small permease [Burkholderiaceae bacterium]
MNSRPAPGSLERLLRLATRLSHAAVWVAGALTLASAIYVSIDVVTRKFFGFYLGGSDELSGYAFAISISWALSFATLQRANIRIDVVYRLLPVRVGAVLDWLSLVALGVFIAFWTRYAYEVASTSWERGSTANTILATPLWIPQFLWVAGLAWLCVVLALMLLRSCVALVYGDLAAVHAICGIRSTEEEAAEEAQAGERLALGERT